MSAAPQLVPLPEGGVRAAEQGASAKVPFGRRRPLQVSSPAQARPEPILIVEPDLRTRSLLEAGLQREGFEVRAASTLIEAMACLAPDRSLPSMVFCEADLRGSDGFTFCGHLRADSRTSDVPVVLLSKSPEGFHRELAGGAGADQYLPKPLFLADVIATAKLLAGRSSSEACFTAHSDELPFAQVVRALLAGVRAGRIELTRGAGFLAFKSGAVVDASFDGARGEEALRRFLLLASGPYTVSFGKGLARATFTLGLQEFCARIWPKVARWNEVAARSVPLEARLQLDFSKLAEVLDELPDEVNGLVRLFDGRRTVRDCVLESSMDEVIAVEAATRLFVMGVVHPLPPDEATVATVRPTLALVGGEAPAPAPLPTTRPRATSEALSESLLPELARQIQAFNMRMVIENRQAPPAPSAALVAFALRGTVPERSRTTERPSESVPEKLEEAFFTAPLEEAFYSGADATGDLVAVPAQLALSPRTKWIAGIAAGVATTALVAFAGARMLAEEPASTMQMPALEVSAPSTATPAAVPVAAKPTPRMIVMPAVAVDAEPQLNEGIALYDAGNLREAKSVLEGFVQAHPDSSSGWMMLGLSRFDTGDAMGAEIAARRALELDPRNGRARMLLATIFLVRGDASRGKSELRAYLAQEPNGPFAFEARSLLAK